MHAASRHGTPSLTSLPKDRVVKQEVDIFMDDPSHHCYIQNVKDGIQVSIHDKQRKCSPF